MLCRPGHAVVVVLLVVLVGCSASEPAVDGEAPVREAPVAEVQGTPEPEPEPESGADATPRSEEWLIGHDGGYGAAVGAMDQGSTVGNVLKGMLGVCSRTAASFQLESELSDDQAEELLKGCVAGMTKAVTD